MGEDHLSNELSIDASLTESGIRASSKSRFISALDRLFGGLLDIPAAFLEGKASRRRLEDDLERRSIDQRRSIDLAGEIGIEKLEHAAAYLAKEKEIRFTLNKAAVVAEALKDLRENNENTSSVEDSIDGDWLNIFSGYAEKASSDRMRNLWGRILSGEIRSPSSFSLTTLRVLSELDQSGAQIFEKYVKGVLDGKFLIKGEEPSGVRLIDLTFLEEIGLLQEASGMLGADQRFDDSGSFIYRNGNLAIIAKGPSNGAFRVNLISISRAGQEILRIMPAEPNDVALRRIAQAASEISTSIELVSIISTDGDRVSYVTIEKIK